MRASFWSFLFSVMLGLGSEKIGLGFSGLGVEEFGCKVGVGLRGGSFAPDTSNSPQEACRKA